MSDVLQGLHPDLRRRVLAVWRQCRRARWSRLWVRFGLAVFVLTGVTTGLLAVAQPETEGGAILAIVYLCGVAMAAWRWLILPLRHPITLQQAALLIDEQHPELENRVASALEFSEHQPAGTSNWFVNQFLKETTPLVRETNLDQLLDEDGPWFRGIAATLLMLVSLGTVFTFDGLWFPTFQNGLPQTAARLVSLPFTVEPGDVRVRRGDNQMIWVQSDKPNLKMTLRWRSQEGDWIASELDQSATDNVYYHQFANIQDDVDYEVHYDGKRSETFSIAVWSPPEVESIDLTYNYPEYLEQEPREVPNSGNITAVEGTTVDMAVWANKKLAKAEMVFDSGQRVALEPRTDILWGTEITLKKDDKYEIQLTDLEEAPSEYNSKYKITVQRDEPPEIKIAFPRGDSEVTLLEEVPFEFSVSDDHGFSEFGLQYEVSGQEPVRLALNTEGGMQVSAQGAHEILLEELGLEPGDFITWTVFAKDSKPDRRDFEQLGDPFFLEIRPFQMRFEEAMSGAGQASDQQQQREPHIVMKDIIIATWNLRKDAYWLVDEEFEEKRGIIVEEMDGLKEQVSGALGLGSANLEMMTLNEALRETLELLHEAEMPSPEDTLTDAMSAEQRAYRLLLKMQPREAQVQQSQSQGGGGGGGGQQQHSIDALEMERNKNFYEEENLTQQEQEAAEKVLSRIKELAQRQQLVNEEIEKLISELENATTEEEREELQRRLERLEEELEQNLERMDETRQELASQGLSNDQTRQTQESLKEAREQLTRSLDQLKQDQLQQARASGNRALESLGDIEDFLQQFSRGGAAQRLKELQDEFEELQRRQEDIAQRAGEMEEESANPSLDTQEQSEEAVQEILDEKDRLKEDFAELMSEGGELAERSSESQELMSRKLGDWLRETTREGIYENIDDSMQLVKFGVWDAASQEEENIAQKFAEAGEKLADVADSLIEDDIEGLQKALENLDELMGGEQNRIARNQAESGQQDGQGQVPLGLHPGDEPGENAEGGMPGEQGEQPGQETGEQQGPGAGQPSDDESQQGGPGQQGDPNGEANGVRPDAEGDEEAQMMAGAQPGEEGQPGQGAQPGQDGEPGQGQQPGEQGQQGQGQQGQQGQGQQGQQGQGQQGQGGQGQGGQPGQEQSGAQPGEHPGQQGQRGQQQGGRNQQGGGGGGSPWSGAGPGGGFDGTWDWVPENMQDFVNQDYSEWLDRIRAAESLLPENSEFRTDLTRLREQIETMRRAFRERQRLPKRELLLEIVAQPLANTADDIQREIERLLDEKEFVLADEGDIPERYRQQVADYFKELSESETTR